MVQTTPLKTNILAKQPNNKEKTANGEGNNNKLNTDVDSQTATVQPKTKTAEKEPIIELQNLDKFFKVGPNIVPVLKQINLKIYPGEFIIVLGPSGSGKSTLLNSILGLEAPTSGRVLIRGVDITKKTPNQMAKFRFEVFGIIFQRADWLKSLSVLDNITLPLAINNVSRKEREKIAWQGLKEVEMDRFARYAPMELSGGQQQKISLVRSLVNDPPILVADEPTGNLDSISAEKVMQIFKDLNEKDKKTIFMITHNIDYVRYASRTVYIRDGELVEGMA